MKKSPLTPGMADKFVRICRLILPAILLLGATAAAQTGGAIGHPQNNSNSLVGQWRGVFKGITITIVMQPNGQYSQLTQQGTAMAQQSGSYKLFAPNTIAFSVTEWQPKTMPVYHATGTTGGYYTQKPLVKPPNSMFTYAFNGPNALTLADQAMHGVITLTRVP